MSNLPVNIDATYGDDTARPGIKAHQQHHDVLHALNNSAGQPNGLAQLGADGKLKPAQSATNAAKVDTAETIAARWTFAEAFTVGALKTVEFSSSLAPQKWRQYVRNLDATDQPFILSFNVAQNPTTGANTYDDATKPAVRWVFENNYSTVGAEWNIDTFAANGGPMARPFAFAYNYDTGVGSLGFYQKPATAAAPTVNPLDMKWVGSQWTGAASQDTGIALRAVINGAIGDYELQIHGVQGSDSTSQRIARFRRVGSQSQLFVGVPGAESFVYNGITPNLAIVARAGQTNVQRVIDLVGSNGDRFSVSGLEALPDWAGAGHTAATATAGTATLPTNPEGFVKILIGNVAKRVPYYAV